MSETFERMQKVIREQLAFDPGPISPETTFEHLLANDSLEGVELLMAVEEEFDVLISAEEAGRIATVEDLVRLVERGSGRSYPIPAEAAAPESLPRPGTPPR